MTLSDLKGTGSLFREFIPLDSDLVSLANGRNKFEQALLDFEEKIQDISTRYTVSAKGNAFSSLGQYNYSLLSQNKHEELIPHNICVLLNLSFEMDESLIRKLKRLISNGAKNGIQFIITYNIEDESQRTAGLLQDLISCKDLTTVDFVGAYSIFSAAPLSLITNQISEEKKHDLVESYNHQFKEISTNIHKENFINALPFKDYWFSHDPSKHVRIPVGKSKQHRGEQIIELKTNDVQAHVMLSGGTGSGKTNFLKTFITSAALNYSPNDLELYLIDLKNGTGFDIFRKHQLPHVKLFAMGVENELILNLLEALNDEMNARFNLFTQFGVEDIEKFNKQAKPADRVKRTMLIVDEFATVFEEDNPYQEEIVGRISPLAKKGRAAGINLFFSTQNFGTIRGGFTNLMSEIPIRIVLKSDLKASQALLDKNDAIKHVKTIGDGVVNYKFGNKLDEKDNEFFKGYLLENEDLEKILIDIKAEAEARNLKINEQLVYDSDKPASIADNKALLTQKRFTIKTDKNGSETVVPVQNKKTTIWLGEPTIISHSHFKIELERNFNENVLISGIEKSVSMNVIFNALSSIAYSYSSGEIAIRIFSFLSEDENDELQLFELNQLAKEYDFKMLSSHDYKQELSHLHNVYLDRQSKNDVRAKKVFIFYIGLEKARDLFKESYSTYSAHGELFMQLLEDGNAYNMHSFVEVRQPSILSKIMNDEKINVFKHRIVFHLGSREESRNAIGSDIASSLYKKEKPQSRYMAVYYDADNEKTYHKFKPYIDLIKNAYFLPEDFGDCPNLSDILQLTGEVKSVSNNEDVIDETSKIVQESNSQDASIIDADLSDLQKLKNEADNLEEEDDVLDMDDFINKY